MHGLGWGVLLASVGAVGCRSRVSDEGPPAQRPVSLAVKRATPPPSIKRYRVRQVSDRPRIDGQIEEATWRSAPTAGAFLDALTGWPSEVTTEVKLLWDAGRVYLALANQQRDGNDEIRMVLRTSAADDRALELRVTPAGEVLAAYASDRDAERGSATETAVKLGPDGWTVEMAIPMVVLGGLASPSARIPPEPGDVWSMNIFRRHAPPGRMPVTAAWSRPLAGDPRSPDQLGEIVFAREDGQGPAPANASGKAR